MITAIYPGSFDPLTNGHVDIIKRSAKIFDKVIVAVSYNINKQGFLPIETRLELIKTAIANIENAKVESYNCLTVDYAKKKNATVLIRGLRNAFDFEYEKQLFQTNQMLYSEIETVFFVTNPKLNNISSSSVREIIAHNGDISAFVPQNVWQYLKDTAKI